MFCGAIVEDIAMVALAYVFVVFSVSVAINVEELLKSGD